MRIVSLLPSLTELVCALGHGDDLVGVTHECDFPPGVERLPHLTRSRIPSSASSDAFESSPASIANFPFRFPVTKFFWLAAAPCAASSSPVLAVSYY